MGEYHIVRKRGTGKVHIYTCGCHLEFGHVCYKVQAFIGQEYTQNNAKQIEKAGAMTITPPFNVGDNIHSGKRLIVTKFTKKQGQ